MGSLGSNIGRSDLWGLFLVAGGGGGGGEETDWAEVLLNFQLNLELRKQYEQLSLKSKLIERN